MWNAKPVDVESDFEPFNDELLVLIKASCVLISESLNWMIRFSSSSRRSECDPMCNRTSMLFWVNKLLKVAIPSFNSLQHHSARILHITYKTDPMSVEIHHNLWLVWHSFDFDKRVMGNASTPMWLVLVDENTFYFSRRVISWWNTKCGFFWGNSLEPISCT